MSGMRGDKREAEVIENGGKEREQRQPGVGEGGVVTEE